ncbi:MAG: multiheme c-type cytochrome, partial [Verrucomicrobiota bacterium]
MQRRAATFRAVSEYFIGAAIFVTPVAAADEIASERKSAKHLHANLFVDGSFPTAQQCGKCHPQHYREWSVSQHAYAMVSPVFNTMHAKLLKETNGTLGDFCIRCHTQAGMTMKEPLVTEYVNRSQVSREGVTCIACHRVSQPYGKVSGRRHIESGPVTVPVKGPTGNSTAIYETIEDGDATNDPNERGRKIHDGAERFFQMVDAEFCASCHDVNGPNGLRLEEAFSHFKASPAAKHGVSCQDCHMGKTPGVFSGDEKSNYHYGPAARVAGAWTKPRKLTNHMIVGPDYSIVHPAIFPHNKKAIKDEKNPFGLA